MNPTGYGGEPDIVTTPMTGPPQPGGNTSPLPRTPRLAPGRSVLWRSADSVQLGLVEPMVVEGLTPPLAEMLAALDGTTPTSRLITDAVRAGADREQAVDLLRDLQRAGLLGEDHLPPDGQRGAPALDALARGVPAAVAVAHRRSAMVEVRGSGRIAVAIAAGLAAAGVGRIAFDPPGVVGRGDVGTGYLPSDVGSPRSKAARAAVLRAAPTTGLGRTRRTPDLTILADLVVPDPADVMELVGAHRPHMAVHAHEGVVVIGPVAVPGVTGCLRCGELHRAEADPAWPKLAAQLVDAEPIASLAAAATAAALGIDLALRSLRPGRVDASPMVIELDPARWVLTRRPWPSHPGCICGAPDANRASGISCSGPSGQEIMAT